MLVHGAFGWVGNTARVMADHPVLLRLEELEAMKEITERIDQVHVVVGKNGLETLLPAKMLTGGEPRRQ